MAAKRHLGQHFLSDPSILRRIADALGARPGDRVLEIGPGPGGLTRHLLDRQVRLTVIERDRDLIAGLRALAGPRDPAGSRSAEPGLAVIEGDALEVDWAAAVGVAPGEPWLVIGNIPYNITSPLIDKALAPPRPARIVFLVQREVADRLAAQPGTPEYGALTVGVGSVATVERLLPVPAGAFRPRPRVASAVVRIVPRPVPLVADAEVGPFRRLVTGLFGARRKQLVRALRTATTLGPEQAARVVDRVGLDPNQRPETVAPGQFVALFRGIADALGAAGSPA